MQIWRTSHTEERTEWEDATESKQTKLKRGPDKIYEDCFSLCIRSTVSVLLFLFFCCYSMSFMLLASASEVCSFLTFRGCSHPNHALFDEVPFSLLELASLPDTGANESSLMFARKCRYVLRASDIFIDRSSLDQIVNDINLRGSLMSCCNVKRLQTTDGPCLHVDSWTHFGCNNFRYLLHVNNISLCCYFCPSVCLAFKCFGNFFKNLFILFSFRMNWCTIWWECPAMDACNEPC